MPDGTRRLAAQATGQRGAFTREQANAANISNAQLRGWVQSNRLDRAGFRTYRSPLSPVTVRDELTHLLLDVSGDAWASGPTAAALHGFDGFTLRKPLHVTVRRGRNIQRVGAFVHTTTILPLIDRAMADGFPVTSATRTLIDIAPLTDPPKLAAAVDSAIRDGLTTETFLHERLLALRGSGRSGSRRLLSVLEGEEITRGGHSWLERRFLEVLGSAGLPRPDTQRVLSRAGDTLVRVDCNFPGSNVVVELLGYRWHRTKEQMRRDAERLNQLQLDGFLAMQFTYDQVVDDHEGMLRTIIRSLAMARRSPIAGC